MLRDAKWAGRVRGADLTEGSRHDEKHQTPRAYRRRILYEASKEG
jgi:hypothetical protein